MNMKAIPVSIFEDKRIGNCSNNGISARYDSILLAHPRGYIDVDMDNPPENFCVVKTRYIRGKEYKHIEPFKMPDEGHVGWMFGGCICHTSDSRFSELSLYPLNLHDRQETTKQYALLSN